MNIHYCMWTSNYQPIRADNEFLQASSVMSRRRTMYWRTADVSTNSPSMCFPGRYIGGGRDKSAPTGVSSHLLHAYIDDVQGWFLIISQVP
jgi:hypothetical protein